MDFMERLVRVTDLLQEGTEVFIGDEPETGEPLVIWVNKLNSFETEEARADGNVRRSERMTVLGSPDSAEMRGLRAEISFWDDDKLAEEYVAFTTHEIYLQVMDDLETQPEMRQRLERIRRMPALLDDEGAAPDDPRRVSVDEDIRTYLEAQQSQYDKAVRAAVSDARNLGRDRLEKAYIQAWLERATLDVYMAEYRTTQLMYAMRVCRAVDISTTAEESRQKWDHSNCAHGTRVFADRAQVKRLPDPVTQKVVDALERIRVSPRQAGKSDAPPSSSVSSEQSSTPEAASTPSSLAATPVEPPTS